MKSNLRYVISLEHIALSKIVITIWTNSEMTIELLNNFSNTKEQEILNIIVSQRTILSLPEVFKARLDYLLAFIGFEIFKFVDFLSKRISIDDKDLNYCLSKFFWKSQGIVDRKETVKILIKESILNLSVRYKLACAFCLEEDITQLWRNLPIDTKASFISISNESKKYLDSVCVWSICNEEQETLLSAKSVEQGFVSVSLYTFLCSIHEGVPEAAVYYWQKILNEEKLEAITEAMLIMELYFIRNKDMSTRCKLDSVLHERLLGEIIVFLFTQTTDEYLETLTEEYEFYIFRVLTCFSEWPFFEFFTDTFKKLQPFLEEPQYFEFIMFISDEILSNNHGVSNHSYLFILKEVWTLSSEENKESIYFYPDLSILISTLLSSEGVKLVKLILSDLPPSVREGLMFTDEAITRCLDLAMCDEWQDLRIFVEICVPQEKLEDFKSLFGNKFTERSLGDFSKEINFEIASSVYNFLDDVFKKSDSESPPFKKICIHEKF